MVKILHITPHFGGGVGTVLRALVEGLAEKSFYQQEVVSFEYLNQKTLNWLNSTNLKVYAEIAPDDTWLSEKVCEANLVHIHFWNHPALYKFLHSISGCSARIIMWTHVNGHFAPYLFNEAIVNFPSMFVVSTEFSLSQIIILQKNDNWKKNHLRIIHSTAGLNGFDKIERPQHSGINVGYVGTVDYAKIHPDFIDIFVSVEHKDARFIICGGDNHEEIRLETRRKGVADRFDFLGQIEDVKPILSQIDIFAYPLNRENYGTGEQVLIEAMSAGVPQVVFSDGPEELVVENGVTGFVCSSSEEFTIAIEKLCSDRKLRKRLAAGSKIRAEKLFNLDNSLKKWFALYDELLTREKNVCNFECPQSGDMGLDLFFLSLGECRAKMIFKEMLQCFPNKISSSLQRKINKLPQIFKVETRGSVKHYNSFFNSEKLFFLSKQI